MTATLHSASDALLALVTLTVGAPAQTPEPAPVATPPDAPAAVADPAQTPEEKPKEEPSKWIDPVDGWFDVSRFLEEPHGFLPLAVPITEPALGYGLGGGLVFLHPREEAGEEGWARPNLTVVGGMWTEDGSEGLFAANSSIWSSGSFHSLIGGGSIHLELDLHGIGDNPALAASPLEYSLDIDGGVAEGRWRLGKSSYWVASRFVYAQVKADFEGAFDPFPGDDEVTIAGPALSFRYDSLNNLFTPTRGALSETTVSMFDTAFGGSQDFQLVKQVLVGYTPLNEKLYLGARLMADFSFGDAPFYARPYVQLRGVPALRYQGEHAFSTELELRWQFHERFSLVGFGGGGMAWTEFEDFEQDQDAYSGGVGVRYKLASKFGLHAGIDVAQGPEDTAIYVQVGSAWLRP